MKSVHCGEEVSEIMEFKDFQDDKQAHVVLTRDPDDPISSFVLDVKNSEVDVKWPDLEKGNDYHGGAKAYLAEIKGTWKERWSKQIYFFNVIVGNKMKDSDTIMIDPHPDKGITTVSPVIPVMLYNRHLGAFCQILGMKKVPKLLNPNPISGNASMGKFDIEFKKGEVLITVAIKLDADKGVPSDISKKFKDKVEGFWNGVNGFSAFVMHWIDCIREDLCNCSIVYNTKNEIVSGGCCKIPVRLVIENSSRHGLCFQVKKRGIRTASYAPNPSVGGSIPTKGLLFYPESSSNTWAHEVGHCLGFPDQYVGGHNWNVGDGKFPISFMSIMGPLQGRASKDHLHYAITYIGDKFKIIHELVNR